jgi:hypothetical protein
MGAMIDQAIDLGALHEVHFRAVEGIPHNLILVPSRTGLVREQYTAEILV